MQKPVCGKIPQAGFLFCYQVAQRFGNVRIQTDRFFRNLLGAYRLAVIDANISCVFVFRGGALKRIFNDSRGVVANAQFKQQ